MDRYEALAEILKDESTVNEIIVDSVEETANNLAARGINFTADELKEISACIYSGREHNGEMNEEELEGVSGGLALWTYILPFIPRLRPILPKW